MCCSFIFVLLFLGCCCCLFVVVVFFVFFCVGFVCFVFVCLLFGGGFLICVFLSAMIKAIIMKHFSLRLITYVIYENYYLTVST